jgi:pimeloyl-ACP methyl ester carboxylesterase
VVDFYKIKRFIGLGVGAGGNILCRYALAHPEHVDALILVNCVSTQAGWIEWGYQKLNTRHLKSRGQMTQAAMEYLMWHHFGKVDEERNFDLIQIYKQYFERSINSFNLGLFMESYVKRTDLGIIRELDLEKKKTVRMIRCPTMMITGNFSPHVDDTVTMNGRLDPSNSNWMKIQDCGLVLEEQPAKVSEAIRLFLQGQGYVPTLSHKKMSISRAASIDEEYLAHALRQEVRITENPINEHAVC